MTIKTSRRAFLTTSAVAGAASLAAPAYAQGKRSLKMATGWPKKFPGLGVASQRIGDAITAATDGRLTVEVFGAGELVPAFEAFDAVASGAADMYHAAEYYWQGKSTAFNFFAGVPFGMTTSEHNAWIYHRGGQELWEEVSASFGL
ncbi:MAG: twin-arginine translocation signal domain-containing protein, partial [Pseudomonadota bacterium]